MSAWASAGVLAGGLGLFLLGMGLMTDGLKRAAGPALERILLLSTRTRGRALAAGVLVTALVQASGAVIIACIGFVNAGLLTLGPALWVLFGANLGTTMTGWLVALVGMQFRIETLALPLIGFGMALRISGAEVRRGALGSAVAGFGVLFLGIAMLRDAFSGIASGASLPEGEGLAGVLSHVLAGIVLTVLMQSSSASLTIALTAAEGGLLTAQAAAAVVIGANIGTTFTAMLAAIGATPNAKRAAAAHVLFNALTGVVALALLPWLIDAIRIAQEAAGFGSAPAAKLAIFHTIFNLLGVLLMWPLAGRLTTFLEARFRTADEDEARPRHLDANVLAVPEMALDALEREIRRMGEITLRLARLAVRDPGADPRSLARDPPVVERLDRSIAEFVGGLNRAGMSAASAKRLARLLRVARYYEAAAELSVEALRAGEEARLESPALMANRDGFCRGAAALLAAVDPGLREPIPADHSEDLARVEADYQTLKAELLEAGAAGTLPVRAMEAALREFSAARRAVQQAVKAAQMLAATGDGESASPAPEEGAFG